ncbi:treslin-like [Acanthaster planci]|uniref:Treslin-like n=1 Tax=Acanthaster planci TaxID=133434 RepID=A0A8B8A2K0_ACAPL|nr:treslin-like [Acanthaster planci]
MAAEERNFKAAFLIDTRRQITSKERPLEADTFSRGVRLCVLKLLSYFTHIRDHSQQAITHLRWGFKVFHSYDYPPCRRDYLKQLSVRNFQDFEDQLSGDLEGLASSIRGRRAPKTPQVLTATSVRQALDDVLHDFQWDGPDVCSPVKRSSAPSPRRGLRMRGSNCQLSKCVFLMMPCPVSRSEMEEFCDFGPDDPLPRTSEFLEMVLPTSGAQQIFQDQNIALFWIDTSPWISTEKRDNDGLSVISLAMRELGGCVIPVHALVSHMQHVTTSLMSSVLTSQEQSASATVTSGAADCEVSHQEKDKSSSLSSVSRTKLKSTDCPHEPKETRVTSGGRCDQQKKTRSCSFLPFSTVMDYYLNSRETVPSEREKCPRLKLSVITDGKVTDLCCLELCPLTKGPSSPSGRTCRYVPSQNATASPLKATSTELTITAPGCSHVSSVTNQDPKIVTDGTEASGPPSTGTPHRVQNQAFIKTKLPSGVVPISLYQTDAVYACTGFSFAVQSAEKKSGPREDDKLSGWFREAMISLSQQKKVLLVDMTHPEVGTPVMAVLEPLTSTTASLRTLKSWPLPGYGSTGLCDEAGRATRASINRRSRSGDDRTRITRIAEECVKRRSGLEKMLENPQGAEETSHPIPLSSNHSEMVSFRPHVLEPWYPYCPSGGASARLLDKLQSFPLRDKPHDSMNPTLPGQLLQRLVETYNRQPGINSSQSTAMKTTEPVDGKTETQARQPAVEPGPVRQSPRLQRRKSTMNVGFRTEKIMSNSLRIRVTKEPSPAKRDQKENRAPGSARTKTTMFKCPSFDSEQDVIDCIQAAYEKGVSEGSSAVDFVPFITSIVLSYMKSSSTDSGENEAVARARELLTRCLLVSSNQLRDKYQSRTDESGNLLRVQEIEVQVLLRLEMEAISPTDVSLGKCQAVSQDDGVAAEGGRDDEENQERGGVSSAEEEGTKLPENVQKLVDEIVKLLRAVPFLADTSRLTTFLADNLLQNYADSLPHVLRVIYDDLMQPVPSILLSPGSSDVALSSVKTQPPPSYRSSSHGSFPEPSVSSIRTRSLVRHPSLVDMGSKRVIPVPSRNAAKKKDKTKAKEVKDDATSNAKTVRRNLFMGGAKHSPRKGVGGKLPRRQSVAVMQSAQSTRKSPRRRTPQRAKAPLVLKTRVVKETPGKKQVLQAMLKKQERARRFSANSGRVVVPPTPTRVIEESPLKPPPALNVRRSPRVKPRKPGDRRSFYSTSSVADLKRARDLGSRIAGKATPPPPDKPLPPASRKSLLSEICSPRSLPGTLPPTQGEPESSSRNTRSQVKRTPSKDLVGKATQAGTSPNETGKTEDAVFKTPTRAPRRLNIKSPPRLSTIAVESTSDGPSEEAISSKVCDRGKVTLQEPVVADWPLNVDKGKSPSGFGGRPAARVTQKSSNGTGVGEDTSPCSSPLKMTSPSRTPKSQGPHTRTSSVAALSVPAHAVEMPLEDSTSQKQPERDGENVVTPSRRSQRLQKSSSLSNQASVSTVNLGSQPAVMDEAAGARTETSRASSEAQDNSLHPPRHRKRALADRTPSPNCKTLAHTPSPQKLSKSATPSSLHEWQRKKRLRRDSPERSTSPIFSRVTPPSAQRKRKPATPPPAQSPKFGRVTPYSEKRKRGLKLGGSTRKQSPGTVTPEESLGKSGQYKLGKVRKANVNLLTLMMGASNDHPIAGKMQTRSQSRESAKSAGASSDLSDCLEEQQPAVYTFLDTHLDDSDDDVDFPKMISPIRPKARAVVTDETSPDGVSDRPTIKSPSMSARSSASVFLSEDEASFSTDDVFLQASPSHAKRKLRTTSLTTGGLFELMNSPLVESVQMMSSSGSKVSFGKKPRKGRQLYPSGSQSSVSSHRSSSLGLRRLSSKESP